MHVIGIDPGNIQSAVCIYDSVENTIVNSFIDQNEYVMQWITCELYKELPYTVAIEKVASYGMPVGETVFETVWWSGRFHEKILNLNNCDHIHRITRNKIKNHICHSSRAKDSNIRQALIDRFGPPGTKKQPGKTYGLKKDMWAALAVSITCYDLFV